MCFTRKLNHKIFKTKHITTSYRSFEQFNKFAFLNDIERDIRTFIQHIPSRDEDFESWHTTIMKHLDNHAPVKAKCVKSKRLPDWYSPEITNMQKLRDNCKRLEQWIDNKTYHNKTKHLIRKAKLSSFLIL